MTEEELDEERQRIRVADLDRDLGECKAQRQYWTARVVEVEETIERERIDAAKPRQVSPGLEG